MARILPSASRRTPNNANNHHPQSQKGALARTLERWRTLFSVKLQLLISGFELRAPGAFYSLGRAASAFGEKQPLPASPERLYGHDNRLERHQGIHDWR